MYLSGSIIIEVTRWCNLECEHCLRGQRQRKRQTYENMRNLISHFDYIDTVTFTGGEPTLAPDVIGQFIDACRIMDRRVANYYIATNAHKISKQFLRVWERLHAWCDDNEISGVDISNDQWHDNEQAWKLFDFGEMHELPVRHKYDRRYKPDYDTCISEGRAENWSKKRPDKEEFRLNYNADMDILSCTEGVLYLNCKGNLIHGCDWSFESQDNPDNIICHVNDFDPEMLLDLGCIEEY